MNKDSKIYVAGHTGLVGSAIYRELLRNGYNVLVDESRDVDLTVQDDVFDWFLDERPEYVFLAAAHAGGIKEAIDNPAEMLLDNIYIASNVICASKELEVKKLLNIGSSCLYPVDGEQPYKEEQLGTGKTDENWSYAVAKIAAIELCRAYHKQYGCNFITVNPCNMYGPNDNFDYETSHVIPALIRKFHESAITTVWGNNKYTAREFLYSDDFAAAAVMLMERYDYNDLCDGVINVGPGIDVPMVTLVETIRSIVNPKCKYSWDASKPSGVRSKLLDVSRIKKLGWEPKVSLQEGIKRTYDYYCSHNQSGSC